MCIHDWNMLHRGSSNADSKCCLPAASCWAAALCCGSGNGTHHEENARFHLDFSLSSIAATYFLKSKLKLLASWTAVFLIFEKSRTNRQQSSDSRQYFFMNAILPFLSSFVGSCEIISVSARSFRRTINKWFKAASTTACILITNVQSSSFSKLRSGEWARPNVRVTQSSKNSERKTRLLEVGAFGSAVL